MGFMAVSSVPNFDSAPSAQALQPAAPRKFERIPCDFKTITIVFLAAITLGGYFIYQAWQLGNDLHNGNIDQAEKRIRNGGWGLYQYALDSDTIRSLAVKYLNSSVRMIAAQIDWEKEIETNRIKQEAANEKIPASLSWAAETVIGARDGDYLNGKPNTTMCAVVPYEQFPRTNIDHVYSYGNDDYSNIERFICSERKNRAFGGEDTLRKRVPYTPAVEKPESEEIKRDSFLCSYLRYIRSEYRDLSITEVVEIVIEKHPKFEPYRDAIHKFYDPSYIPSYKGVMYGIPEEEPSEVIKDEPASDLPRVPKEEVELDDGSDSDELREARSIASIAQEVQDDASCSRRTTLSAVSNSPLSDSSNSALSPPSATSLSPTDPTTV